MKRETRAFLTAMQYFTRLPAPTWIGHAPGQLNQSARYFAAVGILVGCAGAATCFAAALAFTPAIAVLLSTVATAWMTGAFHEDGLADTFDGLGGSAERERALTIMKDSRLGTFGAVALLLVLALKVASLSSLPVTVACAALIAVHPLSRWCALLIIRCMPYARDADQSRAKPVVDQMQTSQLMIGSCFGIIPLIVVSACSIDTRSQALLCVGTTLAAALAATAFLARWFKRRVGGYTGDMLGATQQLTEVVCYLCWVSLWKSY
jgi:adenosylcobinamide-GDP ribazoletransferase